MTLPRPITPEQFERVEALLETARKKTRPRTHSLYDVLCAIIHRWQNKLPWRGLPPGFPPWRTIHEYNTIWTTPPKDGGEPLLVQAYKILELL